MGSVKTAISIPESLFEQAERLSRQMKVSRSQFFARAVEAFISRHESRGLLEKLNEAYADAPAGADKRRLRSYRRRHKRLVEGQW